MKVTAFFFLALLAVSQAAHIRRSHATPAHHEAIHALLAKSTDADIATQVASLLSIKAKSRDVWEKRILDVIDELLGNIQGRIAATEQAKKDAQTTYENNVNAQKNVIAQKNAAISNLNAQIVGLRSDISNAEGVIKRLDDEFRTVAANFDNELKGHNTNAEVVNRVREYIRSNQAFDRAEDQYDSSMQNRNNDNCLTVTLYEHDLNQGRSLVVKDRCEQECLRAANMDETVSSIRVERGPAYTEGSSVWISEAPLVGSDNNVGRTYELTVGDYPFSWFAARGYNDVLSRVAIECKNHRATVSAAAAAEKAQAAALVSYKPADSGYYLDATFNVGTNGCKGVGECQFMTSQEAEAFCNNVPTCVGYLQHPIPPNGPNCAGGFGCFTPRLGKLQFGVDWKNYNGKTWIKA